MKNIKELLVNQITSKLEGNKEGLSKMFFLKNVKYFIIDNLLDDDIANKISDLFPKDKGDLLTRKNLRENKTVGLSFKNYDSLMSDIIFAFQDQRVIDLVSEITKMPDLYADPDLYAGGLSMMQKGNFLNPHLDNSHNYNRTKYRAHNLLYYCSKDWDVNNGGNFEVWHNGPTGNQETLFSKFNRLVVMKTDKQSWHSVSQVTVDASRNCVSNYYFCSYSPDDTDFKHVTTFRGRPGQLLRDITLRVDSFLRNSIRKLYNKQHTDYTKTKDE